MKKIIKIYLLFAVIAIGLSVSTVIFAKTPQKNPSNTVVAPTKPNVALTFDDGPDPAYTRPILNILDKYGIKATFFMIGEEAERFPELVKEIKAHGHSIANHSMTHPMLTRLSAVRLSYEINQPNVIIKKITGDVPHCLRPPYGAHNRRVDAAANEQGLTIMMWDISPSDYERPPTERLANYVIRRAHPGDIILMHDGGGNRSHTVAALPEIIEALQKRGMGFERLCT